MSTLDVWSSPDGPHGPSSPATSPILSGIGGGAGTGLPIWLLACCGAFTVVATAVSVISITLQLKNYRKPPLQRAVVRIMVMVPLYAISSFIALYSLDAAFFIDAVRDLYEAFVIYTFLQLLITYLGGERSLLILLHGRPPIPHPFPVSVFLSPMDVSDPWVLLNLKRGVLQYVQIKPLLVIATITMKATGTYHEGVFSPTTGYTYVSIVYNFSIFLSLYCLAMFWVAVSKDLRPFRPVPKFLCVKGILFFSFWQSAGISFLVSVHAIRKIGPYTDAEHMSLALTDSLICFEMPIFAIAHQFAFQASDYIDKELIHAARLPFIYALRDAFGWKDIWEDTKDTIKGRGVSYQAYEPAEGAVHHDAGRQRRIRAGLRYSKGGRTKYWLPVPGDEGRNRGETGPLSAIKRRVDDRLAYREGYAPLLPKQAAEVVHVDPNEAPASKNGLFDSDSDDSDAPSLDFGDVDDDQDQLYERARRIGYAGFPNVDVSKEAKQKRRWEEEEGILKGKWNRGGPSRDESESRGRRTPLQSPLGKGKGKAVYGAWADRANGKPPPRETNGHAGHGQGEWLFDGENERPDAWRADGTEQSGQLKWTNHQPNGKAKPPKHLEPPKTDYFSIGTDGADDDADQTSPASSSRSLPPDAVDLVTEDAEAETRVRSKQRRKGEPQTSAPSHVYRHNPASDDAAPVVMEARYSPDPNEDRMRSEVLTPGQMAGGDPKDRIEAIEERMEEAPESTSKDPSADWAAGRRRSYNEDNPWA